ncbi:MAG: ABC transporter permease [Gammaproteobacteria bacterium]|nr:ABC transporter permease [Gammaproteobacteria bacterium]MDH5800367.1 ABC transporter permease [Gammaproteobacteria bacterium]
MSQQKVKRLVAVSAKELLLTALLLLGVSWVVFLILYLAPGDPFVAMLGGRMLQGEEREAALQALGLPSTWYGQYFSWLINMLQGDFGESLRNGQPVAAELWNSGLKTLLLTMGALLVTLLIAVPVSIYNAIHTGTKTAWILKMFAYIVSALPLFWLAYVAIYWFTQKLGMFPVLTGSQTDWNWVYIAVPVVLLGVGNGAISEIVRHLHEELGRVLNEEYIRTARAKGASVWRHAFKEGLLLPVSEIIASKIPFVIGGAIIVEQIFNWPGMGRLAWQAALDRDFPVIMGIAIVTAVFVRFASLCNRFIYISVNPRASNE